MVLPLSQYKTMSKYKLIQELTDINSSFVNYINDITEDVLEKDAFLMIYMVVIEWKDGTEL